MDVRLLLSPAELAMLRELIEARREEGSYYGNKEQYTTRLERLFDRIQGAIDHIEGLG